MATPENKSEALTRQQVSREFHRILDRRADIGSTIKILSSWFFQPPPIFDPNSRRRAKPEILIVLGYLLLTAALYAAFNWR